MSQEAKCFNTPKWHTTDTSLFSYDLPAVENWAFQ